MKHFSNEVAPDTANKIKAFADHAEEVFDDIFKGAELYDAPSICEIQGNPVSGWIPFQDGGFNVSALCANGIDQSYHVTEKQTAFNEQQATDCLKAFLDEHNLSEETDLLMYLSEEMQAAYCEHENDWFDPAVLSLRIWIDGGIITIDMSINYVDAPYYRAAAAETINKIELSEAEFLALTSEELVLKLEGANDESK